MRRWILAALCTLAGCAAGWSHVQPGMSSAQVRRTMGSQAPTRVVPYANGESAWYYGEDRCVLFERGEVVAKEESRTRAVVEAWPVGGLSVRRRAVCVPPQHESEAALETRIRVRGLGGAVIRQDGPPRCPTGEVPA